MRYTNQEFIDALDKAVEMRGADYVYPKDKPGWYVNNTCQYQVHGEPACIVGLALHILDPQAVPRGGYEGGARLLLESLDIGTPDFQWAVREVQASQDQGYRWGDAMKDIDRFRKQRDY